MIIDSRKDFHEDYRHYTLKCAVASVVGNFKVGKSYEIESLLDVRGEKMNLARLQTLVHAVKGTRVFHTRKPVGDGLATVWRVA